MTITGIIARLGHECRLPWAHLETKRVVDHPSHRVTTYERRVIPPTLAGWQAEHEREHPGEPGPVASWTDGRVSWSVLGGGSIRIAVGRVFAFAWACDSQEWCLDGRASSADWAECVRLMQAADGGGG